MKKQLRWRIAQYFEVRWWKNYLAPKDWDVYLNWKKGYWQGILNTISPVVTISTDTTLADIGCGPAGVFIAFPKQKVLALDPLLEQYEANIPAFKRNSFANVQFLAQPFETYEAKSQQDVVFCMNAINHFQDLKGSFKRLQAMVAPKGYLVITIDGHRFSFFRWLFSRVPLDILHPHQYYLTEYERMVDNKEFDLVLTHLQKKEPLFNHYLLVFKRRS
jgi:SAM-dependent methyltransferase